MTFISRGILSLFLLTLMACAPQLAPSSPLVPPTQEIQHTTIDSEQSWWACRFKVAWAQNTEPDMSIDLLLAQAVISPILKTKADSLSFWRFHRRAAPDDSGHQFSFLFYSDTKTLTQINTAIQKNAILRQALKTRIIEYATCDNENQERRTKISAMSDVAWSPALQKHWPAFIMGVSRLWLGLINEALSDFPSHEGDFSKRLEQIRIASKSVNAIWYREGQHAFFHHLSAIFGYEPLLIRKEIRF